MIGCTICATLHWGYLPVLESRGGNGGKGGIGTAAPSEASESESSVVSSSALEE